MRILVANLRHLYQRRGLWIVYAGLVLVVVRGGVLSSLTTKGRGLFGGFLVGSFLLGLLVATLQMETASQPFSFCLPGHRDAVRRLVFLVGLVVSLALSADFRCTAGVAIFHRPFRARSITLPEWLIVMLGSYFCASVTAYLLGADVAFSRIRSGSAVGA